MHPIEAFVSWVQDVLWWMFDVVLLKAIVAHYLADRVIDATHPWFIKTERQALIMLHYTEQHGGLTPKRCVKGKCDSI